MRELFCKIKLNVCDIINDAIVVLFLFSFLSYLTFFLCFIYFSFPFCLLSVKLCSELVFKV